MDECAQNAKFDNCSLAILAPVLSMHQYKMPWMTMQIVKPKCREKHPLQYYKL